MKNNVIKAILMLSVFGLTSCGEQPQCPKCDECEQCETCEQCKECEECEDCPEPTPVHEHTFSTEYSCNESCHWFAATCEHNELTSGLEAHTFVDGVCKCGYEEPKPAPTETFFLPESKCDYQNGVLVSVTEYTYDDDFHGYEEFLMNYSEGSVVGGTKRVHKFNDDYTTESIEFYDYHLDFYAEPNSNKFVLELTGRDDYEYFENGSYKQDVYVVNPDTSLLDYTRTYAHFYNDFYQETLQYQLKPIENSSEREIFSYVESTFNADHRITRREYYEGTFENKVLDSYDVYEYDGDNGLATEYIYNKSTQEFEIDCYTDIVFSESEGISYRDEQIRFPGGETGNHNRFGYDQNGTTVLLNYNNIMVSQIKENDAFQITNYTFKDYNGDYEEMNVSYNEDGLIRSTIKCNNQDIFNFETATNYYYNGTKQMVEVAASYVYNGTTSIFANASSTLSYFSTESEELLSHMNVYNDLYRTYSHEVLVYGLY